MTTAHAQTINAHDFYSQTPSDRIHAFQLLDGRALLGYIWFGEYEPDNAAGTLAAYDAGEDGQGAALYWAHRLQQEKDRGMSASDAVLELRENQNDGTHGEIEYSPITVKNLATLQERADPPSGLDRVRERRQELIDQHA